MFSLHSRRLCIVSWRRLGPPHRQLVWCASQTTPVEPKRKSKAHITCECQRTFVDQHQAEVVPRRVLLVDVAERGCQVKSTEEQTDGNGFTCTWSAPLNFRMSGAARMRPAWQLENCSNWVWGYKTNPTHPLTSRRRTVHDLQQTCQSQAIYPKCNKSVIHHVPRSVLASHSRYIGWVGSQSSPGG